MNKAIFISHQPSPLNQDIKGSHHKPQPCLKVLPHSVSELLELTYVGQHRQYCLYQHPHVPPAPFTDFKVLRVCTLSVEVTITKDYHLVFDLINEVQKNTVVHVSCTTSPM